MIIWCNCHRLQIKRILNKWKVHAVLCAMPKLKAHASTKVEIPRYLQLAVQMWIWDSLHVIFNLQGYTIALWYINVCSRWEVYMRYAYVEGYGAKVVRRVWVWNRQRKLHTLLCTLMWRPVRAHQYDTHFHNWFRDWQLSWSSRMWLDLAELSFLCLWHFIYQRAHQWGPKLQGLDMHGEC